MRKQPKFTYLLASTSKSQQPQQMAKAGEIKLACFIAEHNLAFNVASHLTNLVKSVCPDSKIGENLSMSRTKARAIVVNVTGKTAETNLVKNLRENNITCVGYLDDFLLISKNKEHGFLDLTYTLKLLELLTRKNLIFLLLKNAYF